jgi:putative oxidoreductase
MAMVAEFFGGIFLTLGLFTRPFAIMLAFDMFVASLSHLKNGDGLMAASHAIELGIVFIAFILIGSGPFGLDKKMKM